MLQLAYLSTAIPGMPPTEFNQLLLTSRRRNIAAGVTGQLVYDGLHFLQVLEGEREDVEATYERIRLDTRHRAVILLSSTNIDERQFGSWEMAAQIVRLAPEAQGLTEIIEGLIMPITDPDVRVLFRSFATRGYTIA